MTDQLRCPECGKPLPATSAHGVCPACLMAQAMASRTVHADRDDGTLPAPPSPEEIADRFPQFEVVECLGRGGMGVVYKARQKSLDRWVAIKILHQGQGADERFAARFEREARTLAKMSHPNIVTVFDHGEVEGLYHIVMEFVDGVNLRDLLRDGKIEPEQALAIVPPICEALEYAHDKGVVHRDIKPENLLLDREGRVRIADFGIASLVGAEGERSGTPPYMAPEQERGVVDRRADIYALGAVLYEMLTGERPAHDLVAPSKRVEVDVKIDEMVLRALEKQPERRYQTAEEFRTVVQTIATPAAAGAPAVSGASAVSGGTRWKLLRGVSLAGGLAVMVAVAGIIFCVKIVPGWEQGWAEKNRSLSTGEQLLFGMSHFCQRIWPLLALFLLLVSVVSVAGYLVAVRRQQSGPSAAPATKSAGMFRRWWKLGLAVLLLSPVGGIAIGFVWSQSSGQRDRVEAMADLQVSRQDGDHAERFPALAAQIRSAETLREVSEQLKLTEKWRVGPDEAVRRVQRMIEIEALRDTDIVRIRVHNDHRGLPDDLRDVVAIRDALVEVTTSRGPGTQILSVLDTGAEFQRRDSRLFIVAMIIGGLLGILSAPLLALLAMALAQRLSSAPRGGDAGGGSAALSWLAVFLAFLSALIPTLFYWLRPLHGEWLSDRVIDVMLNATLVAAVLAIGVGWWSRRIKRARLAAISGGISLTVWILFFVAGKLSEGGRSGGELAEKQGANDRPSEHVAATSKPENHAWAGVYQGKFAGRKVVWRIVEQNGDYYWLEDPSAAIRDHNRLDQREGALIAEDPAERFRFSPSGAGLLLEVWIKRNGEKVEIELARMEEGAPQPVAPEKPPGPRPPPVSPLAGLKGSLQPLNLTEKQAGKIEHWLGQRGAAVNPAALAEFVKSILRDDQQAAFKKIIESGGRPANGGSGGASGPIPSGRGAHRKPIVEALGLTEPVQVIEADIFPDGETQVVRLKDAAGKEFAACIDSRMDREAPETPGSMFIGVRHPSQPGGRKVAVAGPEEAALHAVLLRWAERQPDWNQVAAMSIHEGHEANRLLWELGRFIRALESRLAETGRPGDGREGEGSE